MKSKILQLPGLLLTALLLMGAAQTWAQTTTNHGLIMRVVVDGVPTDFYNDDCGYDTVSWGGKFLTEFCAPVAWAYDVPGGANPDSLCCDALAANSMDDKVALMRRGICNASVKALNVQNAGAVVALIGNDNSQGDDCFILTFGAGTAGAMVTIPTLVLSRYTTNFIDNALKNGSNVEICFVKPDIVVADFFFPLSNVSTPVSQIAVDTFGFQALVTNADTVEHTNIVVTAGVEVRGTNAPGATLFSVSSDPIASIAPGAFDTVTVDFDALYPPELPLGSYKVVYTTQADSSTHKPQNDRKLGDFQVTPGLFAKESRFEIAYRPSPLPDTWAAGNLYIMSAGAFDQYMTDTAIFTFATNAADLPAQDVEATIYLFRVNDDVAADWSNFEFADFLSTSLEWKGTNFYAAPTGYASFTLQQVPIEDLDSGLPGVMLDNGARYFLMAQYAGASNVAFHGYNDADPPTAGPGGVSSIVYTDDWGLGGFVSEPNAVLRMTIELVTTTDDKPLPETAINVYPNPVSDVLNLAVNFDKPTDATITIAELSGRVILMEDRQGLVDDNLTFNLPQNLASGVYLARIATAEGTRTKKFVVQK